MRRLAVPLFALSLGACRGNFDATPDAAIDSPPEIPLPALVCARREIAIDKVAPGADLAVTNDTDAGYVAAWVDPSTGQVAALRLDRNHVMVSSGAFLAPGASRVGGLEVRPERVWLVTSGARGQALWNVASRLESATLVAEEDTVLGSDPIGAGAGATLPMWIRGARTGNALQLSYLTAAGGLGASATYVTENAVTALSATDYADHVHLGWREANGRCMGADVDFATAPVVASPALVTTDCTDLRIVSGPPPHDPLVTGWTTAAGEVRIRYVGSTAPAGGQFFETAVGTGRAPKITFDGEAYWLAWEGDGEVRFAHVDSAGAIRTSAVPTITPVGTGAFELVRRGISVDLVILSETKLTFLSLCSV